MKYFNPYTTFKSGKYENYTYNSVWEKDKNYFYFLSDKSDYWNDIVKEFERRDKIFKNAKRINTVDPPSTQEIKELFTKNPILGFDMSDFIVSVYTTLNDAQKLSYYESLLKRNNIK